MAIEKTINVVIACRRDNDYNYAKVATTFIPKSGEICLVDTSRQGLCAIVGDGSATYGDLLAKGYVNDIFIKGFYQNGTFYNVKENPTDANILDKNINKIYIDLNNNNIYYYNGENFVLIGIGNLPTASTEVPGIMKLYNAKGNNTDGTISQFLFTQEINKKIEMNVDEQKETVIFGYDLENRV